MNLGKAYRQLFELQDILFKQTLDPNTEAKDKAACARAWETLENRKRILRGRPLPGVLRPHEGKRSKPMVLPVPDAGEDKERKAS